MSQLKTRKSIINSSLQNFNKLKIEKNAFFQSLDTIIKISLTKTINIFVLLLKNKISNNKEL